MTARESLQKTVAQQRQRQTERARNPYTILIDEPPESGQYVEIRDSTYGDSDSGGVLVKRVQPPLFGTVTLDFHEGRVRNVDVRLGVKV